MLLSSIDNNQTGVDRYFSLVISRIQEFWSRCFGNYCQLYCSSKYEFFQDIRIWQEVVTHNLELQYWRLIELCIRIGYLGLDDNHLLYIKYSYVSFNNSTKIILIPVSVKVKDNVFPHVKYAII